jgi:hypothetical protein
METTYWRGQYVTRPYYSPEYTFEEYEPAYRAGWEAFDHSTPVAFSEREKQAQQSWENEGGAQQMTWDEARSAAEDAYDRVYKHHSR